jgi:hypothetical protein
MLGKMTFALVLTLAADPELMIRYDHQTLSAFNSSIGATQAKLGLYSATVCNVSPNEKRIDEGQLIMDSPYKAVNPALNLSIIEASHRPGKWNNLFRFLEWGSEIAAMVPGPTKGPRLRYFVGAGSKLFRHVGDKTEVRKTPPEVIQALIVPGRRVILDSGSCTSRLFFARYDPPTK